MSPLLSVKILPARFFEGIDISKTDVLLFISIAFFSSIGFVLLS
jgi:hypothetical protein